MDVSQRSPQSIFISLMSFFSAFKSFCLLLNLPLHSDSFLMVKEMVKITNEFTICFLRLYIIQKISNTKKYTNKYTLKTFSAEDNSDKSAYRIYLLSVNRVILLFNHTKLLYTGSILISQYIKMFDSKSTLP